MSTGTFRASRTASHDHHSQQQQQQQQPPNPPPATGPGRRIFANQLARRTTTTTASSSASTSPALVAMARTLSALETTVDHQPHLHCPNSCRQQQQEQPSRSRPFSSSSPSVLSTSSSSDGIVVRDSNGDPALFGASPASFAAVRGGSKNDPFGNSSNNYEDVAGFHRHNRHVEELVADDDDEDATFVVEMTAAEERAEKERERQHLAEAIRQHLIGQGGVLAQQEELMSAVKTSLRAKVAALAEDNWMFEKE